MQCVRRREKQSMIHVTRSVPSTCLAFQGFAYQKEASEEQGPPPPRPQTESFAAVIEVLALASKALHGALERQTKIYIYFRQKRWIAH